MSKKLIVRAVTGLAGVVAFTLVGATSAHAALWWHWDKPGGDAIGSASYTDSGDVMFVNDQEVDDHSMVFIVRRPGADRGQACWDHYGAGDDGHRCTLERYEENVRLEGFLCKGEWSEDPDTRRVLWNKCDYDGAKFFLK